jgi:hypothetical protein
MRSGALVVHFVNNKGLLKSSTIHDRQGLSKLTVSLMCTPFASVLCSHQSLLCRRLTPVSTRFSVLTVYTVNAIISL